MSKLLSREELIKYLDYFYSHSPVIDDPEADAKQAYSQIKSLLTPIPRHLKKTIFLNWRSSLKKLQNIEEKLNEFKSKWGYRLFGRYPTTDEMKLLDKCFKAYDELKEEK